MRVYINDKLFTEEPSSCGSCPYFFNGRTALSPGDERGNCLLFEETHHRWKNPPSRCCKIFRKASSYDNGEKLVIIANTKNHEDSSNT